MKLLRPIVAVLRPIVAVLHPILVLLLKDLRVEWRGRFRFLSIVLFGGITLVLFSFAIDADDRAAATMAPGFLILALLLSSTLGLSESFRVERENRALEGLLLLPVEPAVLFYAKALGNFVFLTLLAPVLLPSAIIIYGVDAGPDALLGLFGVWLLAAAGLAAPGTLYAAMTSRASSQDVLLPLLLFPLVIPVLIASVKSAALVLHGDPMDQTGSWFVILLAFDVIYWALGGVLAAVAMEE